MYGIDDTGFTTKRLPEIKADMEESVRQALGADATLLPDSIEGQIIAILSEIASGLWEELHGAYGSFNPLFVTGQALDNLVFLNGLSRLPALKSNTYVDITGTDGTVIPAGSIIRHSSTQAEFLTSVAVTIGTDFPTGTAQALVNARKEGAILAAAGTLTVIGSPVNGWDTVNNSVDVVQGRNTETDTELRARRNRSLFIAGSSSLDAILSEISRLESVVHSGGVENFSDVTDANGVPPHSFEAVVSGGLDSSIGSAIWDKKPAGIQAFGTTTVQVLDIFGNSHDISFTRPTSIPIYFRANVTFLGEIPADASIVFTDYLLRYISGELVSGVDVSVGDNVVNSRLYTPLNLAYPNHTINSLETSIDNVNWSSADISISYKEVSSWDESRITFTVG